MKNMNKEKEEEEEHEEIRLLTHTMDVKAKRVVFFALHDRTA
jgi:hypothetical protein